MKWLKNLIRSVIVNTLEEEKFLENQEKELTLLYKENAELTKTNEQLWKDLKNKQSEINKHNEDHIKLHNMINRDKDKDALKAIFFTEGTVDYAKVKIVFGKLIEEKCKK